MNASQLGAAIALNIPNANTITSNSIMVNPPSLFLDGVLLKLGLGLAAELCKSFNNIGGVFMVLSYCLSAGGHSEISFRHQLLSARTSTLYLHACCWEICRFLGIILSLISLNATQAISSDSYSGYVSRCINTSVEAICLIWTL
jgi:hypothetical protein